MLIIRGARHATRTGPIFSGVLEAVLRRNTSSSGAGAMRASAYKASVKQIFVERPERQRRVCDLDLQNPQPYAGALREIPQITGLVDGVGKVADAVPLDLEVQLPAQARRALLGIGIKRLAGHLVRAPIPGHVLPQRGRRGGAGLHLRPAPPPEGRPPLPPLP